MDNKENKNRILSKSEDLNQPTFICGAGCGCDSGCHAGFLRHIRLILGAIIIVFAVVLVVLATSKNPTPEGQALN